MAREESGKSRVSQSFHKSVLPKDLSIPDDFKGVLQINVQRQRETETETETVTQTQNTAVTVSQMQAQLQVISVQVQQLQELMQPITVQVQQAQSQQQAIGAQTAAQLQALQGQLQMLFMAILGTPAGNDAGERQQLLREIVAALRNNPQQG